VQSLSAHDVESDPEALDPDARWAMGVSRVAEILQRSPFASRSELPRVKQLLTPLAGDDPERRELISLLPQLERLVSSGR
jgi:hypothetical protein